VVRGVYASVLCCVLCVRHELDTQTVIRSASPFLKHKQGAVVSMHNFHHSSALL
jgi:hypothetical protein